ncbi:hypothetical protein B0J11DRAFT_286632 [Dendryphion nanum]|uniref:Uncharacterized protein n=1 Tax=Dendryphion nanum TaxID=256645 RepID=A0A9P9DX27_9PLEO|nr:hypothetical protein B0J11DRAFT_286632 [Dendryphion nanum]
MHAHLHSPTSQSSSSTCYFSITPSPFTHYSVETPIPSPVAYYSPDTFSDPTNPLLALRRPHAILDPAVMDASKVLQMQTNAAHRDSSSSSCSSSGTPPQSESLTMELTCVRCRRTCYGRHNVVKFGTSSYAQVYCRHCAAMVGYKDVT